MSAGARPAAPAVPRQVNQHPLGTMLAEFAESRTAVVAAVLLVLIVMAAVFAPLITPQNPYDLRQLNILDSRLAPGTVRDGKLYVLGTDEQGRDMFSAMSYGLRVSLSVALGSGAIALVVGTIVGLMAAFVGGRLDALVMRIVDFQLAFPTLMFALIIVALLGPGVVNLVIALSAAQWAVYARTVRSAALVEKEKEYVEAARCMRIGRWRILVEHILPNCVSPLIVVSTVLISGAISAEATLSFLGIGVPVTRPSLGMLLSNGFQYMMEGMYWMSIFPGVALLVTIMCVNIVGDQLRDVLNPRLRV